MQVARCLAGQAGAQGADDDFLRHTEHRRLAAVDQQKRLRRGSNAAVVDIDDARGLVEHRAHGFGDVAAALALRAVNLGDDGSLYRRTRRGFDDLDAGPEPATDLLQPRPYARGDDVALLGAVMLVDEVDLNVAHVATGTQIVLAHQPIEVDRGSRAGVGLVVGHLRYRGQVIAEFVEYRRSLFHRRACRHVDNDL